MKKDEIECTYRYDLDPPSTLKEYHWICYHFKSGDIGSCKAGKSCLWRHYDFGARADIVTSWNVGVAEKYEPDFKELEVAKQRKQRVEAKYKWLARREQTKEQRVAASTKKGNIKDDDQWILSKHDYRIMVALLSAFEKEKSDKVDYFTIGKLAIDHLRSLAD